MRLIDADALNEKLCETTIFIKGGEMFQRMINDAPTVQADGDTISRRALMRRISEEYHKYGDEYDALQILGDIEDFPSAPSAEAEQVTGKLNNRDDSLLKSDSDTCKESKSKLDLISRRAVIELIKNSYYNLAENMDDVWAMVHDVEQLPSAPDSRQRGEWVWKKDAMDWGIGAWVCNKCGCRPNTLWSTKRDSIPLEYAGSRFCGNCGADMRGGEDE